VQVDHIDVIDPDATSHLIGIRSNFKRWNPLGVCGSEIKTGISIRISQN